ncbi:hypothetical protein VM1G_11541 [Cytospora mali]|uniref:Uncharacterized protein n=1 Tax=Cytospora mali TaxID=578113 RepID=A0A194VXM5_CYTMA|nr:hypothetical protein VM1G_11541 [Valsa mali]
MGIQTIMRGGVQRRTWLKAEGFPRTHGRRSTPKLGGSRSSDKKSSTGVQAGPFNFAKYQDEGDRVATRPDATDIC